MKIKIGTLVLIMLLPLYANAAFNFKEEKELILINSQSEANLAEARNSFLASVKDAVDNDPDKKDAILTLKKSWGVFISDKCNFEVLESKGTDAETAELNSCLINELNTAEKYFKQILP